MAVGNRFVDAGSAALALVIQARSYWLGIGSGSNTPGAGDTGLQTALNDARVATTNSNPTSTTIKLSGTVNILNTDAVTEAGIFDGAGSGTPPSGATLWSRHVHLVDNLVSGDSYTMNVTWTIVGS